MAVIPQALDRALANNLSRRLAAGRSVLSLHQHGSSHTNHETEGRKYEFGPSRSAAQQGNDLRAGRERLQTLLGRDALVQQLADAARRSAPVGVMLHHALMDADDLRDVGDLLRLLAGHERAECRLLRDLP